jgi:hypothetical protein
MAKKRRLDPSATPTIGSDGSALAGPVPATMAAETGMPEHFPADKPLTLKEFGEQYLNLRPGMKIRLGDVRRYLDQYAQYRMLDRQSYNRMRVEDLRGLRDLQQEALRQLGRQDLYGIQRMEMVYRLWGELNDHIETIMKSDMSNAEKQAAIENVKDSKIYKEVTAFLLAHGIGALSQVNQQTGTGDPDSPLPFRDPAGGQPAPGGGLAPAPTTPGLPSRRLTPPAPAAPANRLQQPPAGRQLPQGFGLPGAATPATLGQPATPMAGGMPERLEPSRTMMSPMAPSGIAPPQGGGPGVPPMLGAPPDRMRAAPGAQTGIPRISRGIPGAAATMPQMGPPAPGQQPVEEYRVNPQTGEVARRDPITGQVEIIGILPRNRRPAPTQ